MRCRWKSKASDDRGIGRTVVLKPKSARLQPDWQIEGNRLVDARELWQRRALMAVAVFAVAGWILGAPRLLTFWSSQLTFRELPGLAPFRALQTTGGLSAGAGIWAGLDAPAAADPKQDAWVAWVRADPCGALFGPLTDGRLPIAFFSDFNCPNCKGLDAILQDLVATRPDDLRIIRHELPLLGTASTVASQAVLAAERQGGYRAMHDRLMRTRMVTDLNLVVSIAEAAGLDGQRLLADMKTADIASALDRSRAIAEVFGFYGTPATVIGRTVFMGAIPAADVLQIIEAELGTPPLVCGRD
jgi:predicted DsbA family dithiol-disulfide isomerase